MSFDKLANAIKGIWGNKNKGYDKITLNLYGLNITVERRTNIEVPHEVTVVIPRVECRKKVKDNGEEIEIIMNSITIVHSPRHELAGPPSPPPVIPKRK
ncbi:hypothetical protein [Thermoanaerobacterium sp. RBIITD]|uniref:hypothetical protein n=1 Tax=Thermoanaerobacterium sp. RBIITD TaxID=1550240 RepID=UPI000BB6B05D|nr:hypothetical protein [Thermoanaerobacterium sp. RBIITD]